MTGAVPLLHYTPSLGGHLSLFLLIFGFLCLRFRPSLRDNGQSDAVTFSYAEDPLCDNGQSDAVTFSYVEDPLCDNGQSDAVLEKGNVLDLEDRQPETRGTGTRTSRSFEMRLGCLETSGSNCTPTQRHITKQRNP